MPPQEIRTRVDAALRQVGMYDFRLHAPHLLSGGQKQRVAIAGVIAMQPKCIVLDEPTAMLDPSGRREVIDTATKLCREQGITVVLITHHMEECVGADRVIVLSNGAVVADGAPKQVFPQVGLLQKRGSPRRSRCGCSMRCVPTAWMCRSTRSRSPTAPMPLPPP